MATASKTETIGNPKTEFCKSLEWKIKIQWLDKTGIYKYKDGRVARIELAELGVSGDYPGFLVTILNPREGKVDAKFFLFDDYIDRRNRKDDRWLDGPNQYPHSDKSACYKVIASCGWKWYIAEPWYTRGFCDAVEAYVKAFA